MFTISDKEMKVMSEVLEGYGRLLLTKVALEEGFDVEGALSKHGYPRLSVVKKSKSSKGKGVLLPWSGEVNKGTCQGIRVNHGLYTQCKGLKEGGTYCKTCRRGGGPKYGDISTRSDDDFVHASKVVRYSKVMEKLGITRMEAEEAAEAAGVTIAESEFEKVESNSRGRPRKLVDTSSSESEEEPKKRGRPKRNKMVVTRSSGDDLIASLMANASEISESEMSDSSVASSAEKEAAKAVEKAEKEAEKAEKLAAKAAEKAEKLAAKAAEKAEKDAAKAAEKAEKDAAKAAEKAEKDAAKAAEKAAKLAAKEAEKAEKAAEKEAKLAAKAEKEAAKEAEKAEKAAEKEAKLAAKAEKEAAKEAEKAEKAAEKEAAKAEKEAAKEAEKAEKAAEKEAAKAEKEAAKEAENEAKLVAKAGEEVENLAEQALEDELAKTESLDQSLFVLEELAPQKMSNEEQVSSPPFKTLTNTTQDALTSDEEDFESEDEVETEVEEFAWKGVDYIMDPSTGTLYDKAEFEESGASVVVGTYFEDSNSVTFT